MFIDRLAAFGLAASLLGVGSPALACGDYGDFPEPTRTVDLAICLDTSGSMKGLIDAARQKLWTVVNDLALAEPSPRLRVALLTYGNDGHAPGSGWVRVDTNLTDDLDTVSEKMFALTTNGGTELVGRVLQTSLEELEWSKESDALRIVIVAGNESADQDTEVSFRDAARKAIAGGIMVNSIYCGNPADGDAPAWREVAQLADGHFAAIDTKNGPVVVATPFDDKLAELSASINATYVPFGEHGRGAWLKQSAQDGNAASCNSEAVANRARMKGGKLYRNGSWDLVEAAEHEDFDLAAVEREHLAEELRKLSLEDLRKHLAAQRAKRAKIKAEIAALSKKRDAFAIAERKKMAEKDEKSFEFAVRKAVRDQARSRGFRFKQGG